MRAARWISLRTSAPLEVVKAEIVAVEDKEGGMRDVGTAEK